MIIFLSGKDSFRSRQQLKKMVEKFKADRDPQGLNVTVLDAEKTTADQIWQHLLATPFLAERRMVVLENVLSSKHKDVQEELLARIEDQRLPKENVLVLWEGTDSWKSKAAKALAERLAGEKFTQLFDELTGAKLTGWIGAEVAARGGAIGRRAVQELADHVKSDMWRLSSTLDQLIAFTAGREIVEADVDVFVESQADDNIFTLVDAIVARQGKQVFRMLRQQRRVGKDASYIFAMMLRQFRILIELRDVFERDELLPSDVLAKRIGVHPFVVKKSLPIVKRYTMAELKQTYAALLAVDVSSKTGGGDPGMLLDLFIARHLTAVV